MLETSLIIEKRDIEFFIKKIIDSDAISIDIEFMRRNTFFPEPCVIQLSNGNLHACIDLTLGVDYKTLFKSIFKEDKKIILHSCRQDLEILYMILGYIPQNIFDTQFAASFLGFKYQIGYAELIKEIYNIDIDKTEKMTNWKGLGVVPWFESAWKLPAEDSMDIRSANKNHAKFKDNVIKDSIAGNLCRCTGYKPIIKAAKSLNSKNKIDHFTQNSQNTITLLKQIKNESIVYTSGSGGLFKPGIPIGIYSNKISEEQTVTFFSKLSQLTFVKLVSFQEEKN